MKEKNIFRKKSGQIEKKAPEGDREEERDAAGQGSESEDGHGLLKRALNGLESKRDELRPDDTEKTGEGPREEPERRERGILFRQIIEPDERTLGNFINPAFWLRKGSELQRIREKSREDRSIFQVLSEGALPSFDYYVLTVLSCIIATTGLIQGSTATIIGAMIVAPLMTPILAFSLGVIWGDLGLIRTSLTSLFKGIILAIAISALLAALIPIPGYSEEILSRTRPTLFDIVVAFASGLVGAYGNANRKISNTITGIAIAVALMPPLCTIGIGLGTMNRQIASGAGILFLINLISISLAGAIVFWVMRIHPVLADREEVRKRALYQIVISIMILTGISVPLGIYMREGYRISSTLDYARDLIREKCPGVSIYEVRPVKTLTGYELKLTLFGAVSPPIKSISDVRDAIRDRNSEIGTIDIDFIKGLKIEEPRP